MKKKLLGSLIALGGSLIAVGTAFALYTGTLPENKTIQIGTKTSGDVALNARVAEADTAHAQLTPESYSRTIVFNAGFTKNAGSVYIQDYYFAHLEFKISSASAGMISALKEHSWVELGTQSGANAYGRYWGWSWNEGNRVTEGEGACTDQNHLNSDDYVVAEDGKSVSWSINYPLFAGNNVSEFLFHIQMQEISASDYLAIAESSYSVDFNVTDVDYEHFDAAYIVGEATGGWEDKDEFRMVPNAKASGFEWMFHTGTEAGHQKLSAGEYKLHVGTTYCGTHANHTWDEANNGKTFYWNGGSNNDHRDLFN